MEHPTRRVRVTNLERTVIGSIKGFERIGGLEELLNSLSIIPYLDETKLKTYLNAYREQGLFQRTGYLLENFGEGYN
jgi:predicted transcriptional regulator of viral defense system